MRVRKLKFIFNFILCLSFIFLSSCENNEFSSNSEISNKIKIPKNGLTIIDLGNTNQFLLPTSTISFNLSLFGDAGDGAVLGFHSLTDPQGKNILMDFTGNRGYGMQAQRYANILNPSTPAMGTQQGVWEFQTTLNTTNHKIAIRTGMISINPTFIVQPYLTGTKYFSSDIESGLEDLKNIYANLGIQLTINNVLALAEEQFATVYIDYNAPSSFFEELISKESLETINVFFVEDFYLEGDFQFIGLSYTPGSIGFPGAHNGVIISLDSLISSNSGFEKLGETASHEIGHFLGLEHTTERFGDTFDFLLDTPQCLIDNAREPSIGVLRSDCTELDGHNLMFWTSEKGEWQLSLTEAQLYIVVHSPIAK